MVREKKSTKYLLIFGLISLIIIFSVYYYTVKPIPLVNRAGGVDKFGIREIYPTKSNGDEWFMNMNNPNNDTQTYPQVRLIKNNDSSNSWKIKNIEVRYNVYTSSGFQPKLITTLNQTILSKKGYMQTSNDWKNVEMTGYFKINNFTNSTANGVAHIELVARGAKNTNNNTLINGYPEKCESTTYHSNTYETGRAKFEKDLEHTQGYTTNDTENVHAINSSLLGRWIGLKAVYYNTLDNFVRLEQYADKDSNNKWIRVLSYLDNVFWGGGIPQCGGTSKQIITWGGPIAIFRWDNINDMDIKNFSIREIQPYITNKTATKQVSS